MKSFLRNRWELIYASILFLGILQSCKDTSTDSQPPTGNNENCPSGLINYWKFEESASPFMDSEGNNSLLSNTISKTTGRVGEGINIQNQNIINSSSDSMYNWGANASFSVEFWMKDSAASNINEVIIGRNDPGTAPGSRLHWWIGVSGNSGFATFTLLDNNRNGNGVTGTTVIADGNWHHIAFVRDSATSTSNLYVDGQLDNQISFSYTNSFSATNVPLNIGYLNLSPFYYYTGYLDELAIFNSALSPDDIQKHYQNGLNGKNYCQ